MLLKVQEKKSILKMSQKGSSIFLKEIFIEKKNDFEKNNRKFKKFEKNVLKSLSMSFNFKLQQNINRPLKVSDLFFKTRQNLHFPLKYILIQKFSKKKKKLIANKEVVYDGKAG